MMDQDLLSLAKALAARKAEEDRSSEGSLQYGYSSAVTNLEAQIKRWGPSAAQAIRDALKDCSDDDAAHLAEACFLIGPAAVDAVPAWFEAARQGRGTKHVSMGLRALLRDGRWPGGAAHIDLILKSILGPYDVSEYAVAALGCIGPKALEAAIPELIRGLSDPALRGHCAEALERIGPPAALALTELAKVANTDEGAPVCKALGAIGDRSAAGALRKALKSSASQTRAAAAEALGKLGTDADVAALKTLLSRESVRDVRRAAAAAILTLGRQSVTEEALNAVDAAQGPKDVIPLLLRRLGSPKDSEWLDGLSQLEGLGRPLVEAVPLLAAILMQQRCADRILPLLQDYGPDARAAVPAVVHEMKDGVTGYDRLQAAVTLGFIAGPEGIAALEEHARVNDTGGYQDAMKAAIQKIRARNP